MTIDQSIAASCIARTSCRQHNVLCGTLCPWYIDLRYQLELSGIPRRHAKFTVETLGDDTIQLETLKKYAATVLQRINAAQGLYLYGGTGTGKTTAVCALALTFITAQTLQDIRAGRRTKQLVQYVNVPDLLDEIKRGFDDPTAAATSARRLEALQSVPLAIFDDAGAERPSEWSRERLLTVIGGRYDAEKATFFTSNNTMDELVEPLGKRIQSRIAGMTVPIRYDGKDRRKAL